MSAAHIPDWKDTLRARLEQAWKVRPPSRTGKVREFSGVDSHSTKSVGGPRAKKARGNPDYVLPDVARNAKGEIASPVRFPIAEASGAATDQLQQAAAMWKLGLQSKARRKAHCGVLGERRDCMSGDLDHRFFVPYHCGNRYCRTCGPLVFDRLFAKHHRLSVVAQKLVPHWPVYGRRPRRVVAKLDLTIRNTGEMPTSEQVRQMNKDVRQFFRTVERRFGISRKEYGFLWCDEFGGENTRPGRRGNSNLHAHGLYCGPYLPQKELSQIWKSIRTDGSFIVSIKIAKSFAAGLAHALKYAGKFLSSDPHRLAELERTFHRVRRVHTLAAFYNPKIDPEPSDVAFENCTCPLCGDHLVKVTGCKWRPIGELKREGLKDFEHVRRELAKQRVFGTSGGPPS